jgi:hypothetical protein
MGTSAVGIKGKWAGDRNRLRKGTFKNCGGKYRGRLGSLRNLKRLGRNGVSALASKAN